MIRLIFILLFALSAFGDQMRDYPAASSADLTNSVFVIQKSTGTLINSTKSVSFSALKSQILTGTNDYQEQLDAVAADVSANSVYASLKYYGAIPDDSLSDDLALTNALAAADEIVLSKGVWNFSTNQTIGATKTLKLMAGAVLKPASGVIISISGLFDAPNQACIDTSAGGRVIFKKAASGVSLTRTPVIKSYWWVGVDNAFGADSTTGLRAWANSLESNLSNPLWLMDGGYLLNGTITISNKNQIIGIGRPDLYFNAASSGEAAITVAVNSNNVRIEGLLIDQDTADTATNTFGIKISDNCDYVAIEKCSIAGFRGAGIYSAGEPANGNLYSLIRDCEIRNCDNSVAAGGNGLYPATAIWSTNVFSEAQIINVKVSSCDEAYRFMGDATVSYPTVGMVTVFGGAVEACGRHSGMQATNTVAAINVHKLNVLAVHLEANGGRSTVYMKGGVQLGIRDAILGADFASTIYATNLVWIDGVHNAQIANTYFNNCVSNYVVNVSSDEPVNLVDNAFDLGGSITYATDTQLFARLSGNITFNGRYRGNGSPEGVVTAIVGKTYERSNGGSGSSFYVKESGTGNTGWVAK